jgi:hypothetical protein
MNLSAPTTVVFVLSLILAVLAVLGTLVVIPVITPHAFWVAILAWLVLAIGNVMTGM